MMGAILALLSLSGFSLTFWVVIGIIRFSGEKVEQIRRYLLTYVQPHSSRSVYLSLDIGDVWSAARRYAKKRRRSIIKPEDVAILIPAHNEALVIERTLASATKVVSPRNVYVASDGSTDQTVAIVRAHGCNVLDINPNRGKAGALLYTMEQFELFDLYEAVIIVDADSQINERYLDYGLPLFNDPEVIAVAAHARGLWRPHRWPRLNMFYVAYRARVWRLLQMLFRYGQTWKYTNVTTIVPGFCSMYRTSALRQIDIAAPGLVIEDYNMTFEVHHKKLGKIAYHPSVYGTTQDPDNFRDYFKQVKRWNLGFWQTVKKHGLWPSWFWLSLGIFLVEMLFFSVTFLSSPLLYIGYIITAFAPIPIGVPGFVETGLSISIWDFVVGIFVVDYLLTVLVAIVDRKPLMLFYGIGFYVFRVIDAFLYLYTIPLAFFVASDGKWKSPTRRVIGANE